MTQHPEHTLRAPSDDEDWRAYHSIRCGVLFENRGHFGVYDENHPDEFQTGHHPMILTYEGAPIAVIRIDIESGVAWFRRVAVREELQRAGHGKVLLGLAEAFARDRGCHEVRSNVAVDAVGFYERCGYSQDASKAPTNDSVLMQKQLA